MIEVSVIIPVFNSDKYIEKCIESLLYQQLKSMEFIFINDGSNDNSQNIIEKFQQEDHRIILINQENKGVSVARNNGLEVASGQYIGFVDADDFVDRAYYKNLFETAIHNNCDIVCSDFNSEHQGVYTIQNSKYNKNVVYTTDEIGALLLPEFIKTSSLNSVCNKIYNADIIKDKIHFPKGVALGEDGIFNLRAFDNSNRIVFADFSGYNYREVIGSATKNAVNKDYFQEAINVYNFNYQKEINAKINAIDVQKWKSIRLINSVISFISIYLEKNNGLSLKSKINYVRNMIGSQEVQQSLYLHQAEIQSNKSKYEQFIVNCLTEKSVFKIVLANIYSQIRNN